MLDSGKCLCLILAGGYTQWQYNFNLILLQGFKEFKLITIPRGSGFMILTYMKDLPRYLFVSCGPDEAQAGIKIAGRNINNLRCADDTTLMTESKEELKSLLMKVKEESEKADLKLNIKKIKIMIASPITSWQIDGETMETVTDYSLGSKITADGDCSHEINRCLLLGRKLITNLDSILKSRDITLPIKVCVVKAMIFLVVMYRCESWTIRKAEC